MDEQWHAAHPLGAKAPMERRIEWHLEHARVCGCRPIPASVQQQIEVREAGAATAPVARRRGDPRL
jgi:hypothetical protein